MILYIHGFRTTSHSHKATLIKNHYQEHVIASAHSFVPDEAIKNLEENIHTYNITGIIASSIGGYYATYLSQKYNIKTVLINPSIQPYESTRRYLGENRRQDGMIFSWEEKHLKMLESYKIEQKNLNLKNFFLFLQTGDEVLDYRMAHEFYKGSKLVLEEGGNHRFDKFERYFNEVSAFLEVEEYPI